MPLYRNCRHKAADGFSLMEVMIVLVIISILAGIILPSFQGNMNKARRSDAMAALLDVSGRMEQYKLDHRVYTDDLGALGFDATDGDITSEEGHYTVSAAGCTGEENSINTCYKLTATAKSDGSQAGDSQCKTMMLDSSGTQSAKNSDGDSSTDLCW